MKMLVHKILTKIISLLILFVLAYEAQALEFEIHGNHSKSLNAVWTKGEIVQGDTIRLEKFLSRLPKKKHTAVYFSSMGGDLYEGMN